MKFSILGKPAAIMNILDLCLLFTTGSDTAGAKFEIAGPDAPIPLVARYVVFNGSPSATNPVFAMRALGGVDFAFPAAAIPNSGVHSCEVTGLVEFANAGVLVPKFSQFNAESSECGILAGSWIRLTKLG